MTVSWYFDFISPFAYLQWPKVLGLSQGRAVAFRPILFAGLLEKNGQKGPAEIPAKRLFTYRHVLWLARQQGVSLRFPPTHPFNPLPALRLCVAAGNSTDAIGAIFDWIWAEGRAADSAEALAPLAAKLGVADPEHALSAPAVKDALRRNFEDAVAEAVFGVPTLSLDGELFWGNDAFAFVEAVIDDPALLSEPEMRALADIPIGAARR
jgi:2-hydroxychromene-2-carboxylate isomerase